jgi:exodeoxyribonuclease-3
MKIATWNVNSIKARGGHVRRWLDMQRPDILCLQELKGLEFPHELFPDYKIRSVGQKAYNGVAILSTRSFDVILDKLPGDEGDEQARYLELEIKTSPPSNPPVSGGRLETQENLPPFTGGQGGERLRVINIYLPNGNPYPGEKFDYKLKWMERLFDRAQELRAQDIPFLITGDFNVIPEARDCWDARLWENDALYRIESRRAYRKLLNLGLTDAFRALNQKDGQYTFWDYQAGCWPANKGIRIDHFLLSPPVTDRLHSCTIDTAPRGEDSPSDHTPVIMSLK